MGLFQILRSIEDLLYEVMTWLVFYPRTLWRVIRHPIAITDYSEQEQEDSAENQYTDLLSPPLFLLLSIVLVHGLEVSLHAQLDQAAGAFGKIVGSAEESLLIVRAILFSIYPLMFAVAVLKRGDSELDRNSLRSPFFSQCYLGGLFAIMMSLAGIMAQAKTPAGLYAGAALFLGAVIWFIAVEAKWFAAHLGVSPGRGSLLAIQTFIKASIVNGSLATVALA